jgi:hypothetical protein
MLRGLWILLLFTVSFAFAQDLSLTELRQEAFRLTVESRLSELPANLQAESRKLLDRAEALREPLLALREKVLAAYIAEVQSGKEPYLAWATARNTVADERLELLPDVRNLLVDIRAFVNRNPEVAPIFRELRENFRENRLNGLR